MKYFQSDMLLLLLLQSNDFFSLFLDETMTYSCAIFKVCASLNPLHLQMDGIMMHIVIHASLIESHL